jgi:Rod binding domain-containing protein
VKPADVFERPSLPAVASPRADGRLPELEQAARQFEALLVREMIHAMVAGSTESGFFGNGTGGATWEELFESGLSEFIGESGGFGIAKQIYAQIEPEVRRGAGPPQESRDLADAKGGK